MVNNATRQANDAPDRVVPHWPVDRRITAPIKRKKDFQLVSILRKERQFAKIAALRL
jgi:hypothetical protein